MEHVIQFVGEVRSTYKKFRTSNHGHYLFIDVSLSYNVCWKTMVANTGLSKWNDYVTFAYIIYVTVYAEINHISA